MLIKVIIHTKVWEGRAYHIILLERQTAVVSKGVCAFLQHADSFILAGLFATFF